MNDELLNRLIVSIALRNNLRNAHLLLEQYNSATALVQAREDLFSSKYHQLRDKALRELDFIAKHDIQTYFCQDDNYPQRLLSCVDAPLLLFSKGNIDINPRHAIGIVGTRMPSERGKDWCRRLVLDLANQVKDLVIVSGLAYGIDITAHRAAIEAGIPTIIVPAHGLDRIYPAVHRNIAVKALEHGGILTEYPSGTDPERYNFVARNRIVASMSDALVVVESKAKGGSLITAQMAIDYGRDVFALPGRYNDECSEGCNNLIKTNRAQLITNAEDILHSMQWHQNTPKAVQTRIVELLDDYTAQQRSIIQHLRATDDGCHINQLVISLQLPYNEIAAELMTLELKGVVKGLPGGMWRWIEI